MDISVEFDYNKYNPPIEISYEQMINDLEEFCYLLETSYAGYDEAIKNGLKISAAKKTIRRKYRKNQMINVDDFFYSIYEQFSPYIKDYHANIQNPNSFYRFIIPTRTYFTNTIVKKENDKLFVVQTDNEELHLNDEITCNSDYLFYYPSKGSNAYRIGILSEKNDMFISIKKDESSINLPVFEIESLNEKFNYFTKESEKSIYIKYNSCTFSNDSEFNWLKAFSEAADLCRDKNYIILDIRGNPGGDDTYSNMFYNSLCFGPDSNVYDVENEDENKTTEINTDKPLYEGKIILITDNNVCSSGESLVEQAYMYFGNSKQFVQIGANTAGCGAYGNLCYYILTNSGIIVTLGITDFTGIQKTIPSFQGEGKGYNPDYWCTSEDIADTIFYITQDEETKNLVKSLIN